MSVTTAATHARFQLVTAGHHFLLNVLPFRQPASGEALETFIASAKRINACAVDVDFVLLQCLAVLSHHTPRRIPSLIDEYRFGRNSTPDDFVRFSECVEGLLRYHAVTDGSVQDVLRLVRSKYGDTTATPQFLAAAVGQRLATLDVLFKKQMGCTLTEHIRDVRLSQAAVRLATTNKSIKEVWAEVGYAHHSNFDHDFKRKFGCTPREYRSRAVRPIAQDVYQGIDQPDKGASGDPGGNDGARNTRVLIVDDDEECRTCVSAFLRSSGYWASAAGSGSEGLRIAEHHTPNVILLDYHLGDMDGLEFLRIMRGRPRGDLPSVSLFTADCAVFDRSDEISELNAIIATKLCDLDQIKDLIVYLSDPQEGSNDNPSERQASDRWWTRWMA